MSAISDFPQNNSSRESPARANHPSPIEINRLASQILRDIECPVTADTMKNPKTLPCGHSLDESSLTDIRNHAKATQRPTKCPTCRAAVPPQAGTSNIQLKSLAEQIPRLFDLLGIGENTNSNLKDLPTENLQAQLLQASQAGYKEGLEAARKENAALLTAAKSEGIREGHQRADNDLKTARQDLNAARAAVSNARAQGFREGLAQRETNTASQKTFFQQGVDFIKYAGGALLYLVKLIFTAMAIWLVTFLSLISLIKLFQFFRK